ncbi:hypothetical protein HAX54_046907 [Datura stramonium]|uniref:Uncharacterized protein n=1 Tax=Datura stramonium TaxID=4076 RepID=A0ABS8SSC1_DATST|nr:hypothetical protein [Datura stramonium]
MAFVLSEFDRGIRMLLVWFALTRQAIALLVWFDLDVVVGLVCFGRRCWFGLIFKALVWFTLIRLDASAKFRLLGLGFGLTCCVIIIAAWFGFAGLRRSGSSLLVWLDLDAVVGLIYFGRRCWFGLILEDVVSGLLILLYLTLIVNMAFVLLEFDQDSGTSKRGETRYREFGIAAVSGKSKGTHRYDASVTPVFDLVIIVVGLVSLDCHDRQLLVWFDLDAAAAWVCCGSSWLV